MLESASILELRLDSDLFHMMPIFLNINPEHGTRSEVGIRQNNLDPEVSQQWLRQAYYIKGKHFDGDLILGVLTV